MSPSRASGLIWPHGHHAKYRQVLQIARERRVDVVVNGGDLLPNGGDLHDQQAEFLDRFLDPHLGEYDAAGIQYVAYLGNDDLRVHDERFKGLCARHPMATNLAQAHLELDEFDLIGTNWVVDYPFRLKDRCRMDTADYRFGPQFGSGLLSKPDGFEKLADWPSHAETLPTIEEELDRLPSPRDPATAIYVIHMPPANLGLDVCGTGETVGSEAVYRFIERVQPLLTLHGHIHESPDVSRVWRAQLGRTWCIQPGQMKPLSYVLIELPEMQIERIVVAATSLPDR